MHTAFWSLVVVYLLFLLYLILTPQRVAGWCRRLAGGAAEAGEVGGEEEEGGATANAEALGYAPVAAEGPEAGGGLVLRVGEAIVEEADLSTPRRIAFKLRSAGQLARAADGSTAAAAAAAAPARRVAGHLQPQLPAGGLRQPLLAQPAGAEAEG